MYAREWRGSGQPWHCPICTKTCCCTLRECPITHRHCKAYRYRRKRAQLAQPTLPTSLLMPNVQHCDPTAPPPPSISTTPTAYQQCRFFKSRNTRPLRTRICLQHSTEQCTPAQCMLYKGSGSTHRPSICRSM